MRTFSQIEPKFWLGGTGKQIISSGPQTTMLAFYFMTCPSSHASGIYYNPINLIVAETHIETDDIYASIDELEKMRFVKIDIENHLVWVINMGEFQSNLTNKKDKKYVNAIRHIQQLPKCQLIFEFAEYYGIEHSEILTGSHKISKGHSKGLHEGHDKPLTAPKEGTVQVSTLHETLDTQHTDKDKQQNTPKFPEARHAK